MNRRGDVFTSDTLGMQKLWAKWENLEKLSQTNTKQLLRVRLGILKTVFLKKGVGIGCGGNDRPHGLQINMG